MLKVYYEDDDVTEFRKKITSFSSQKLKMLELIIRKERRDRQMQQFKEWEKVLASCLEEHGKDTR